MLQSLFPKENMDTITLNPISTRKLKSEPKPDPMRPESRDRVPTLIFGLRAGLKS